MTRSFYLLHCRGHSKWCGPYASFPVSARLLAPPSSSQAQWHSRGNNSGLNNGRMPTLRTVPSIPTVPRGLGAWWHFAWAMVSSPNKSSHLDKSFILIEYSNVAHCAKQTVRTLPFYLCISRGNSTLIMSTRNPQNILNILYVRLIIEWKHKAKMSGENFWMLKKRRCVFN